ncbi:MAG: DUF1592 domain-containing protein, partial [Verrucomicrobiota bacterium]|nr:DUF1592 domain-containing protein [Verrucomicrobiota bacterium]
AQHMDNHELWLQIWKNLRSDLMPPAKKEQPKITELQEVIHWIERNVFLLDHENPDPGRITMRRLNRVEYGHTIQDLLGIEFNVTDNFPPDDTGYGFDTIGDVLTISPLLMEKYFSAAEQIIKKAMPEVVGRPQPLSIAPNEFRQEGNNSRTARFMRAGINHTVRTNWKANAKGTHRLKVDYEITGRTSAQNYTSTWQVLIDGKKHGSREINLAKNKAGTISLDLDLSAGMHQIEFGMVPNNGDLNNNIPLAVKVLKVEITGPKGSIDWNAHPESYRLIFSAGPPPKDPAERDHYTKKLLNRIASRAFRRPVNKDTLNRLINLVKAKESAESGTYEAGIRLALTAVLSSPPFLLRGEESINENSKAQTIDEYSLASRLSYFLWSSTPDAPLLKLAAEGKLRSNLRTTVDRMLKESKSDRFIDNFVGQWLQTRDLEEKFFDTPRILGIDDGNRARQIFNLFTRQDMKRETELLFSHILKENRPAIELITANYSFINDRLAKFYGINGFKGKEFRKVSFEGNPRPGGILTHGSFLIITSNPTRTSPVKRGLFVIDNLLGVPNSSAPPDVPELEKTRQKIGKDATMRELLELHRAKPLCRSCHARMDPIGLALENYNAIGQRLEKEGADVLDTSGVLVTGEKFEGISELKKIIAGPRKKDFHRCLTEKLFTYALGRGVEYYDSPVVNKIIKEAVNKGGGLKEFIYALIESVSFQRRQVEKGN